jgi:ornithine cyclodeaminase/alanine dehydrogenase-like protein (mu-crystallin family)
MMRLLREADVTRLISLIDALAAVELAFREQARGTGVNSPRHRIHQPHGVLHMMGGALTERGYWGFKAYTATRHGVRFTINLYDVQTGALRCIMEADYLGQLRTGAASGVATRYLARSDARTLALIGTGYQAETQLAAIAAVCTLAEVRVFGRNAERRLAFAKRMSDQHGLAVRPVASPAEAVADADIITTATTAAQPVLDGKDIAAGTHINAAGSNSVARAELDRTTVKRAGRIFTDDLAQARQESGDLVMAYERNALAWETVRPLADVVAGLTPGRSSDDDITLFASHGIALWDVALAATAFERAEAQNLGSLVEFGS